MLYNKHNCLIILTHYVTFQEKERIDFSEI